MTICCPNCIGALCDFCIWYDFNADTEGCYTGDGYCRLHNRPSDPDDACPDFYCVRAMAGQHPTGAVGSHREVDVIARIARHCHRRCW